MSEPGDPTAPPTASTGALRVSPHLDGNTPAPRRRVVSWALWDWGSAAFNAVVTTFVFSTYLASGLFVDPAIVAAAGDDANNPALVAARADSASVVSIALTIAGILIALIAPVLGQRSDGSGRRKLWLGVNTGLVVLAMAAMFFVEPRQEFLVLGATLLAVGNIFFEFASVNYNAMLVQVSTPRTIGRISGFGWGLGYVGGIVLLIILLVFFILDVGAGGGGILGMPTGAAGGSLDIRVAVLASAVWFAVFAIPVLVSVPEIPRYRRDNRVGFLGSYRVLIQTIRDLYRHRPQALLFLAASAIFRDGLAGVFTFGAIIAANVFHFSATEVLYFAVAANLVAGIGTFVGGSLDDRVGAKTIIIVSLAGLVAAAVVVLFIGTAQSGFWIAGLALCLFVGPIQSASRSFLARITPEGREGEIFGLYATTGRAVSFLTPALFTLFVTVTHDTRYGILGIAIVLAGGLALMIPVKDRQDTLV
ncbi:MFS transporter [Klugiella xanthotipulae]|uniref:UMF1 family MFS transporter n=1 Tax=Klugiella xanthotipulae TaxID=244735 RepID=A0A543I6H3_9MICO|nr:MFS transporter [Klugiella xanthotipulae]TQM66212.1 UMF1 family MFS transporter [Klugiella xanthotipulae]